MSLTANTPDTIEGILHATLRPFTDEEGQEVVEVTWDGGSMVTDLDRVHVLADMARGHLPASTAGPEADLIAHATA